MNQTMVQTFKCVKNLKYMEGKSQGLVKLHTKHSPTMGHLLRFKLDECLLRKSREGEKVKLHFSCRCIFIIIMNINRLH